MSEGSVVGGGADREILRMVHTDLDVLEAHLAMLSAARKADVIDSVLRLRREVIEAFPSVALPISEAHAPDH